MVRKRGLTNNMANLFKTYLDSRIAEASSHGSECAIYFSDGRRNAGVLGEERDSVTLQDIQVVSTNPYAQLGIRVKNPDGSWNVFSYKGENPYQMVLGSSKSQDVEIYMDELYDMQRNGDLQANMDFGQEKRSGTPNRKMTQLVGVSKKSLRFRQDTAGNAWVNVAVPWAQSKNGLGNIDIPRTDFDRVNTKEDMQQRSTYHIPLKEKAYGMWFIDKNTGKPVKPVVETRKIYESYEGNRSAYRSARIMGGKFEADGKVPVKNDRQLPVSNSDLDFDLDDFF